MRKTYLQWAGTYYVAPFSDDESTRYVKSVEILLLSGWLVY